MYTSRPMWYMTARMGFRQFGQRLTVSEKATVPTEDSPPLGQIEFVFEKEVLNFVIRVCHDPRTSGTLICRVICKDVTAAGSAVLCGKLLC
jgi:hypothetical protein